MTRLDLGKTESEPMKMTIRKLVVVVAVSCSALLGCYAQTTNVIVCDNGLKDWLNDTNHTFGVWVARSTRIVETPDKQFHTQFRDCQGTNTEWIALYDGDKTYDELFWAQFHLRHSFELKKGICDAFEDMGHKKPKAP